MLPMNSRQNLAAHRGGGGKRARAFAPRWRRGAAWSAAACARQWIISAHVEAHIDKPCCAEDTDQAVSSRSSARLCSGALAQQPKLPCGGYSPSPKGGSEKGDPKKMCNFKATYQQLLSDLLVGSPFSDPPFIGPADCNHYSCNHKLLQHLC